MTAAHAQEDGSAVVMDTVQAAALVLDAGTIKESPKIDASSDPSPVLLPSDLSSSSDSQPIALDASLSPPLAAEPQSGLPTTQSIAGPTDAAVLPTSSSSHSSSFSAAAPPTLVYSCPCCCPCEDCVAARSACTDPNCQTCRPSYTHAVDSSAAATATAPAATATPIEQSATEAPHQHSQQAQPAASTTAATIASPTLATAVVTATTAAAAATAPTAAVAMTSPSFSYSTPIPVTSASWINAPVTATTPTAAAATPTAAATSTIPCSLACCSPASAAVSHLGPSTPATVSSAASSAPLSITVPSSLPTPSDDKLATFSALLYRCLTNRAALQRMFDCGCLEHFISEQTSRMNGDKKPALTVNTSAAALHARPLSSPVSVKGDEEGKGKKRRMGGGAAGSPKSAKKVKAERPPKSSPSPSTAKRGRRPNRAGAASPAPSEPSLTPCSSPTALSSVLALVRSTTMPVESGATVNAAYAAEASAVVGAVEVGQSAADMAVQFAAPLPSPKAAAASPRRAANKAARRSTPKGDKSGAGSSPSVSGIKRGPAKSSIASAPNTPMSSRVLDLSGHKPQAATPRALTAMQSKGRGADGYSPVSSQSIISSISSTSTVYSASSGESALSPSLHFSSHHTDSLLPALSLPSAYPEVAIQGVMEDVSHTAPDVDEYRSYGRPRQMKAELVDDLMPQSGAFRYRPRTLSESHPMHPLHAISDSDGGAHFQHDFLVHDAASSSSSATLSLDGDNQPPLSPSSSSYHSGADSMDTEHSSPMPELERDAELVNSAHSSQLSSTRSNASSSSDGSSWALNLDMDAMPLSIELTAS